jgi:hypothetical protein
VSKLERWYERNIEPLGGGRGAQLPSVSRGPMRMKNMLDAQEQKTDKGQTTARVMRAQKVCSLNAGEQMRQQRKTQEPSKELTT